MVGGSGTGTLENPLQQRAFSWTSAGGIQELGTLGGSIAFANAINKQGDIAGTSALAGSTNVMPSCGATAL